jgi:hypothetical protein
MGFSVIVDKLQNPKREFFRSKIKQGLPKLNFYIKQ